jgi:hypothetical protein
LREAARAQARPSVLGQSSTSRHRVCCVGYGAGVNFRGPSDRAGAVK